MSDLVIGVLMMAVGVFAYWWTRNRRDLIRGLTYKQFVWCCVLMIVSGALFACVQFFFEL